MSWGQIDIFLSRSKQFCFTVIILCLLVIFFALYYSFIVPIENQIASQLTDYYSISNEVDELQQKINTFPDLEILNQELNQLLVLSEIQFNDNEQALELITTLISDNQLQLIDFAIDNKLKPVNVNYKLQGNYHEFVTFFEILQKQNLNLSLKRLLIYKQHHDLIFDLTILINSQQKPL